MSDSGPEFLLERTPLWRIGKVGVYESGAEFRDEGRRRLSLYRTWGDPTARLLCIGLNPSKANATTDDATIRVVVGFAARWGYGRLDMANLFTWIETDSTVLSSAIQVEAENGWTSVDIAGDPDNLRTLHRLAHRATGILCCWGAGGRINGRAAFVLEELRGHHSKMFCLGKTKAGHPKHPLRQSVNAERVPLMATP